MLHTPPWAFQGAASEAAPAENLPEGAVEELTLKMALEVMPAPYLVWFSVCGFSGFPAVLIFTSKLSNN